MLWSIIGAAGACQVGEMNHQDRHAEAGETYVFRSTTDGKLIGYRQRAGSRKAAHVLLAIVAFHLAMTLVYLVNVPIGPLRGLVTAYMEPVFKQSWYVFAPDPVSRNAYLEVRAKRADGQLTDWFNISKCDTESAIKHHVIPNRRYLTTFQLTRHYEIQRDNLPAAAREVLTRDFTGPQWTDQMTTALRSAGAPEANIKSVQKNNLSTRNLVAAIARARWGNVPEVQLRIRSVYTRPFPQRNTDEPLKTETWQAGFTPAPYVDASVDSEIAKIYGAKAGC